MRHYFEVAKALTGYILIREQMKPDWSGRRCSRECSDLYIYIICIAHHPSQKPPIVTSSHVNCNIETIPSDQLTLDPYRALRYFRIKAECFSYFMLMFEQTGWGGEV